LIEIAFGPEIKRGKSHKKAQKIDQLVQKANEIFF
jgi:hypothetical protein